jgi:hypothetical protein
MNYQQGPVCRKIHFWKTEAYRLASFESGLGWNDVTKVIQNNYDLQTYY